MYKQSTIVIAILSYLNLGSSIPVMAQSTADPWDLGLPANARLDSAAAGEAGIANTQAPDKNANGSPAQPYSYEASQGRAIAPSRYQTNDLYYSLNSLGKIQSMNTNTNAMPAAAADRLGQYGGSMRLPPVSSNNLSPSILPPNFKGVFNGLPPTNLDSFVRNAGGHAEEVFGDEGTNYIPLQFGFNEGDTIEAAIRSGKNNKTLTTGHGGSKLPAPSGNGLLLSR